jgi:hypothetical protein
MYKPHKCKQTEKNTDKIMWVVNNLYDGVKHSILARTLKCSPQYITDLINIGKTNALIPDYDYVKIAHQALINKTQLLQLLKLQPIAIYNRMAYSKPTYYRFLKSPFMSQRSWVCLKLTKNTIWDNECIINGTELFVRLLTPEGDIEVVNKNKLYKKTVADLYKRVILKEQFPLFSLLTLPENNPFLTIKYNNVDLLSQPTEEN